MILLHSCSEAISNSQNKSYNLASNEFLNIRNSNLRTSKEMLKFHSKDTKARSSICLEWAIKAWTKSGRLCPGFLCKFEQISNTMLVSYQCSYISIVHICVHIYRSVFDSSQEHDKIHKDAGLHVGFLILNSNLIWNLEVIAGTFLSLLNTRR